MSSPAMPDRIAKYAVEGILGSGAMGVVYKAFDEQIHRPVAIKVLHEHLRLGKDGDSLAARFLQEARAAARCLHPNIVTVFDFGNDGTVPYIVMEFVEGVELRSILKSTPRLPVNDAVNIVLQVLEALAFAHGKGVVHRDVKPDNIIMLPDGTVKVSDFGVARLDASDLTGTGFMIGTPSYMSPEGLQGKHVDGRSDLFSVAVVLFELISGQRFNREIGLRESLDALKSNESTTKKNIARVQRILGRALQSSAGERFQHAAEFMQELRQLDDLDTLATVMMVRPAQDVQATRVIELRSSDAGTWDGTLLQSLEQSLATYVGPVAKLLVKKCSRSTDSFEQLIEQLTTHIPNELERGQFRTAVKRSGITSIYPTHVQGASGDSGEKPFPGMSDVPRREISAAQQTALTELLAFYTGPIAQRLVKKYWPECEGLDQLAAACGRHIPDSGERQEFLGKVVKI